MEIYNPYLKTAITRSALSVPMRELMNLSLLYGDILDYGCGKGFDVNFLSYLGLDIIGYDKYNLEYKDESLLDRRYDVICCNYVLNVIPNLKEHQQVIDKLRTLGDNVYVALRNDRKAIKESWIYIEEFDCYETPKHSFQRYYTNESIKSYFGDVEIIKSTSSYILFKLI